MTTYAKISSPRSSMETSKTGFSTSTASISSQVSAKSPSVTKKIWTSIKQHAKEHHESVNAAYSVYYGQGQMQRSAASPQ
jgi:hypothetical protein